jgi:hypothetical protein
MSGRSSGSSPYSVTESNAVDSRVAGWPALPADGAQSGRYQLNEAINADADA